MSKFGNLGRFVLVGVFVAIAAIGCSDSPETILVKNERPQVELSAAPLPMDSVFYAVRMQWFASDSDGRVENFIYAVDPPASGDTTWTSISRYEITIFFESTRPREDFRTAPGRVASSDFHVFVIKAVDNEGMESPPVFRAFTSYTVAPQSTITSPAPSRLLSRLSAPSVLIQWSGQDPDGVLTQEPILYKFKLVSEATIQQALGLGGTQPSADTLQFFFGQDAPEFATWDSVPPDSSFRQVEGLTPGQDWYFAVVGFDEAGAYEPRFLRDANLLKFRPSTQLQAPLITVFNSFFTRKQNSGGINLQERDVIKIEVPVGREVVFNWFAEPSVQGTNVTGYRWIFDPIDGDIFDETPRENDDEVFRWSSWSLTETQTTLSASLFEVPPDEEVIFKRFYVQARDNIGSVSMATVEIRIVEPTFDKDILVFDDRQGRPDFEFGGSKNPPSYQPGGDFPDEATLDTLLHAVGGKDYRLRPDLDQSVPGVFAGFDHDSLDFRFEPFETLPLSVMARYKTVVWFIGRVDAGRDGVKFLSNNPMSALRYANSQGNLNTAAVYSSLDGGLWMFGDGIFQSIGNGYVQQHGGQIAPFPYNGRGDEPSTESILWPGNFLYDYFHLRSEMDINNRSFFNTSERLIRCIPYLPDYATDYTGDPQTSWTNWPPAPGTAFGDFDDPRIGPSSLRHEPRWDGLEPLTITTEYPNWPGGVGTFITAVPYVSLPNFILEDPDGDGVFEAALDTLYLMRATVKDLSGRSDNADGKPVMLYYRGMDNGPVCWTGMPIWKFERTQLQTLADKVLFNLGGHMRNANPATTVGPGDGHARFVRDVTLQ